MAKITIILPVSREDFLQSVFASLEALECDKASTDILVVVDGDASLYLKARNYTELSKFNSKLCVQFKDKETSKLYSREHRRLRIAKIHNFIKTHIQKSEFIFGVEDDTILRTNALKKLHQDFIVYPHAGFIEGVQVGRWGIPYIGAWRVDDVYNPTLVKSILPPPHVGTIDAVQPQGNLIDEIDAGGFFCFLTRSENYMAHEFKVFDNNGLGPDVEYGLELRRQGYVNYIDWSVLTTHRTKEKDIKLSNVEPAKIWFEKTKGIWRQTSIQDL